MKVVIYTPYDCILKGDNWKEELEANQHLEIDSLPSNLSIYPASAGRRMAFEIDFQNTQSSLYRIIEKDGKVLLFLLDGISAQNLKIYKVDCYGEDCLAEVGKNEISFTCKENKKVISFPFEIDSCQSGNFYHICFIKLVYQNGEALILYNTKTNIAKVLQGEKIQLSQNSFIVHSKPFGYEEIVEEYEVTTEGLRKRDVSFETKALAFPPQLLGYRFLNAVKLGDYKSALNFLANPLKENFTPSVMKSYFKNITCIFPLAYQQCFAISNNENKIYTFTYKDGLITEIED